MGSHNFALVCDLNVLTLLGNSLCPGDHESHLKIKKIDKGGSLEKKKNGSGYNHKITNKNRRYIHQNLDLVDYSLGVAVFTSPVPTSSCLHGVKTARLY